MNRKRMCKTSYNIIIIIITRVAIMYLIINIQFNNDSLFSRRCLMNMTLTMIIMITIPIIWTLQMQRWKPAIKAKNTANTNICRLILMKIKEQCKVSHLILLACTPTRLQKFFLSVMPYRQTVCSHRICFTRHVRVRDKVAIVIVIIITLMIKNRKVISIYRI